MRQLPTFCRGCGKRLNRSIERYGPHDMYTGKQKLRYILGCSYSSSCYHWTANRWEITKEEYDRLTPKEIVKENGKSIISTILSACSKLLQRRPKFTIKP